MPITKSQRDKIKEIFSGTPISRIEVTFSGGGDDGSVDSPTYYNNAGVKYVAKIQDHHNKPDGSNPAVEGLNTLFNHVNVPFTVTTSRNSRKYAFLPTGGCKIVEGLEKSEDSFKSVDDFIEDIVHMEAMDSGYDWYNNEGGGGSWELDLTTGEHTFELYVYPEPEAQTVVNVMDIWAGCKTARKERKRAGTKAA